MKKGFTLIELLAVIVILAIVALIATPIILGIIRDTKEQSIMRSAENYIDAIEQAIVRKNLREKFNPTRCEVTDNGLNCDGIPLEIEIDGEVPKDGTIIKIQDGKEINGTTIIMGGLNLIVEDDKVKINEEKAIVIGNFNSVCEIADNSTVQGYEAGAKYNCKVDPNKDAYTFYVLKTPSTGSTTIDLIMNQNIYNDGTPVGMDEEITQEMNSNKYNVVNWNNESTQSDGPVTVLKFLNKATKSWTNLKPLNYEYKDKELQSLTTSGYDSLVINNGNVLINGNKLNLESLMYARIPIFLENDSVNTEISYLTETNEYLYDNLSSFCYSCEGPFAYWTLSTYSSISLVNGAYSINGYGSIGGNSIDSTTNVGVRPVITLDL